MRLRLLQSAPVLGEVEADLTQMWEAVDRAKGRDLVVTPELASHGYDIGSIPEVPPLSSNDSRLRSPSSQSPAVLLGFVEQALHGKHNSALLVGEAEPVVQRKLTLPTYREWEEAKHFIPGGRLRLGSVSGARVATLICNDIWQPQLAWLAAQQGAEVLLAPANSAVSEVGIPTAEAWEHQLRGIAVALQCYIVFVNRSGEESGRRYWGCSAVYDYQGEVIARGGAGVEEVDADLDLESLRRARRQTPLLKESRADVVLRETRRILEREMESGRASEDV